ncbi:zinc finger protein 576, tandem duplicate 1 [Denticeps clupeoides]|uniref:Zinc finger protein 576, tandem duplicate 1 n=1 Tax=Denticeps clupeoides TaxID=299321 RepID=A0AAY4AFV6_9TELE|nr:uncharacterized protein LOC114791349 [Denticeps clupeoides]
MKQRAMEIMNGMTGELVPCQENMTVEENADSNFTEPAPLIETTLNSVAPTLVSLIPSHTEDTVTVPISESETPEDTTALMTMTETERLGQNNSTDPSELPAAVSVVSDRTDKDLQPNLHTSGGDTVRKKIPSKKDRMEPLKLDMTKLSLTPLSSSQLSLQCLECHIIFSDNKSKRRHLKMSHPAEYEQCMLGDSLFACYVCDRHFTCSTDLMAHQRAHTERQPFKCPICEEAFSRSSELTMHKKIHFSSHGYTCTDCGKPCKTLTLLKYHRRTHTGERPYVCKVCSKRFSMPKALQKHLESHKEDDLEDTGSRVTTTVKVQKKRTTGKPERKHACSLCNASFKTVKTQLHHMKRKHSCEDVVLTSVSAVTQQPTVTQAAMCPPTLCLQPSGEPLQRIDTIETEHIKRLIESLGNVKKVNQLFIYGVDQVPLQTGPVTQPIRLEVSPQSLQPVELKIIANEKKMVEIHKTKPQCKPLTSVGGGGHGDTLALSQTPAEETHLLEAQTEEQVGDKPETSQADLETVELELIPVDVDGSVIIEENCLFSSMVATKRVDDLMHTDEMEHVNDQLLDATADAAESSSVNPASLYENPHQRVEAFSDNKAQVKLMDANKSVPETEQPGSAQETVDSLQQVDTTQTEQSFENKEYGRGLEMGELPLDTSREPQGSAHEGGQLSRANTDSHIVEDSPHPQSFETDVQQSEPAAANVPSKCGTEIIRMAERKPEKKAKVKKQPTERLLNRKTGSKASVQQKSQVKDKPTKVSRTKKGHLMVQFGFAEKNGKSSKKHAHGSKSKGKVAKEVVEECSPGQGGNVKKLKKKKVVKCKKSKVLENAKADIDQACKSSDSVQINAQVEDQGPQVKSRKRKMKRHGGPDSTVTDEPEARPEMKSPSVTKKKKQQEKNPSPRKKTPEMRPKNKPHLMLKADDPVSAISDPINQQALLLLKGHKQPQLKVHKLDAPNTTKQLESVPSSPIHMKGHYNHETVILLKPTKGLKLKSRKKLGEKNSRKKAAEKTMKKAAQEKSPSLASSASVKTKPKPVRRRKSAPRNDMEIALSSPYSSRVIGCHDCGKSFSEVSALQEHMAAAHTLGCSQVIFSEDHVLVSKSNEMGTSVLPNVFGTQVTGGDWDIEIEMGEIGDKVEQRVSFPALNPSPSLPLSSAFEGECNEDGKYKSAACNELEPTAYPQRQNPASQEFTAFSQTPPASSAQSGQITDSDIKREMLLSVPTLEHAVMTAQMDLPETGKKLEMRDETVGLDSSVSTVEVLDRQKPNEHSQGDDLHSGSQNEISDLVHLVTNGKSATDLKASEEDPNPDAKKLEDAELQRKEEDKRGVARGRKRAGGRSRRGISKKRATGKGKTKETEPEKDECQIVYQLYPVMNDSEDREEDRSKLQPGNNHSHTNTNDLPKEQEEEVLELDLGNTTVVKVVKTEYEEIAEESGGQDRSEGSTSCILLERVLTSKESCERQSEESLPEMMTSQNQGFPVRGILVRQSSACEQQRGVQMFVVKEEDPLILNEPQSVTCQSHHEARDGQSSTAFGPDVPVHEGIGVRSKRLRNETSPVSSAGYQSREKQFIFFPVKEEEKELLLDPPERAETSVPSGSVPDGFVEIMAGSTRLGIHSSIYASTEEGEVVTKKQDTQALLQFLSQSSDTEHYDIFDSYPEAEVLVMSSFNGDQNCRNKPVCRQTISPYQNGSEVMSLGTYPKKPIDYFTQYFDWETWEIIASSTSKMSKLSTPVTAKEVAQFVGIHIAMGTLKFPCAELYWKDYTRVPLIADAMSASRVSELTQNLKLSSGQDASAGNVDEDRRPSKVTSSSTGDEENLETACTPTLRADPLSRVRVFIDKVRHGCQRLKQGGSHGIDQFPLPLRQHTNSPSHTLHHTAMISTCGLIVDFSLSLDDSEREDIVEKMVSSSGVHRNDGMVFLCKPELSTPSMLEHLLEAGVQSAGKVGGAKGQIGDEFISSDGKLKLFRCHHGFILSVAGKARPHSVSLVSGFDRALRATQFSMDLRGVYATPCLSPSPASWPLSVLWHLTDLSLVNSWLQYRNDQNYEQQPLSLMSFRLEVSKTLIQGSGSDAQESMPPHPPTPQWPKTAGTPGPAPVLEAPVPEAAVRYDGLGHWPEQLGEGEGGRCQFGGCERTSRVRCLKCCVFLCISRNHNCFLKFHNQGSS